MTDYHIQPVQVTIQPIRKEGDPSFPTLTIPNLTLSVEALTGNNGGLIVDDANLYRALAVVLNEAAEHLVMRGVDAEREALGEAFE